MPEVSAQPASPLHALCVYAEPLVAGRRVVVIGSAIEGLGERLLDLGARVVHVYDPHRDRAVTSAAAAARNLTVKPLPPGDFDVRDGAFDVAIIPNVARVPNAAALLGRLRRVLAGGGAALVGAQNPAAPGATGAGSLDYYELYDLVALQFAYVRMVGQMPWSGVLLAELGREGDDADVSVDTQLGGEAALPDAFFALASQDDVRLGEYSLIQLPRGPSGDAESTVVPGAERADLAAAQLRANFLEAQLEELRGQRNADGAARAEAVGGLEAELAERLVKLEEVEARARDATAKAARAQADLRTRDEELARMRDRATMQLKEIDDERRLRSRAEIELAVSRKSAEAAAAETQTLLAALSRLPLLEVALAQAEARAHELGRRVVTFDDDRARLESAIMEARQGRGVAAAAEELAVRAAEAEARVAALEAEVASLAEGHGADLIPLESALHERAQVIQALEHELARRERIILDLVHAVEEARQSDGDRDSRHAEPSRVAEMAAADADAESRRRRRELDAKDALVRQASARVDALQAENAGLTKKLDALAVDLARREGESATLTWRIQELEQEIARLDAETSELTMTIPPPAFVRVEREANDVGKLAERLSHAEDEVEMLRQALTQEHEARARAESGEELVRARAELTRQAALLEQLSRELDANDRVSTGRDPARTDSPKGAS